MKPSLIFFYSPHGLAVGSPGAGRLRGYCGASLTDNFNNIPDKPQLTF